MGALPQTVIGQIEFCDAHTAVGAVTPTGIGLAAAQVATVTTATARKTFNETQAVRAVSAGAQYIVQGVRGARGYA